MSGKNQLPYYKRYPRDFFEGTLGMSFELKAAYGLILDLIYIHGTELPDDQRFIAGQLNVSVRKWNSMRAELIKIDKIQIISGFISNYRAVIELESLSKYQDKQAENARKPNVPNGLEKPPLKPKVSQPEPEPVEEKDTIVSQKDPPEIPKPKKRASQLPSNWVPSNKNIEDAVKAGFTQQEISNEADQFRDYHLSKGTTFKDWDAGWRTWLRNARKFSGGLNMAGRQAANGRGQGSSIASIAAQRRLASEI